MLTHLLAGLKAARAKPLAKETADMSAAAAASTEDSQGGLSPPQSQAHEAETLAAILEQKRFHRKRSPLVWFWTLLGPLFAFGLIGSLIAGTDASLSIVLALLFGFLLATAYRLNRLAEMLEAMQTAVLTADLDLCRPGPLAELLEWPHRRVRSVAHLHLLRRLPAVERRDAETLNEDQRSCLRHRLSTYNALTDGAFVCAILEALGVIGDTKALPYVEKLAGGTALRLLPSGRRARKAARICLLRLESRELEIAEPGERPIRTPDTKARAVSEASSDPVSNVRHSRQEDNPQMRLAFLIASWCIVTPFLGVKALLAFHDGSWFLGMICALLALLTTQLYRATLTSKHVRDVRALARTEDIGKVGALADILEWPDPHLCHIAADALARLLPRLKASDAHLLNARQRISIYRMLDTAHAKTYTQFLESVLLALQQIGDLEAIPYVERLASTPLTNSMREDRVKKAAQACLPFLKTVAAQNQAHQTLLRASALDDHDSEDLLRPTPNEAPLNQTQLLRSSFQQPDP